MRYDSYERVFIAVDLTSASERSLRSLALRLEESEEPLRVVGPEASFHITLRFLGHVRLNELHDIIVCIKESVSKETPFEVLFEAITLFPIGRERAKAVVVTVEDESREKLIRLTHALTDRLTTIGFPPDPRGFHPHVTLARVKGRLRDRKRFTDELTSLSLKPTHGFVVSGISLYNSELGKKGARYVKLEEVPFPDIT